MGNYHPFLPFLKNISPSAEVEELHGSLAQEQLYPSTR